MHAATSMSKVGARIPIAAWIAYDMAAHGYARIVSGVGFPVHLASHVAAGRIANECTSH